MNAGLHRLFAALVALSVVLVGLVVAGPALAANTPPWEPDPNSVGALSFYDASGNVITSGRTDVAPFAAYVAGSATIRPGDTQAGVYFANPQPGKTPVAFFREQVGVFTPYPTTTAPASINALSATHPVNKGDAQDLSLDTFEADSIISTTAGYQNVVQVRLRTANAAGNIGVPYESADIMIDPTAHTWTQIYPAASTATPGTYVPVASARLLDTRSNLGGSTPGAHGTVAVQVTGRGGIPATGVSAVVLNVTVTSPSAALGFVTVFADGSPLPTASNLNFVKGQTVPNLVVVPVGANGKVDLYNGSTGSTPLIADVAGYYLG